MYAIGSVSATELTVTLVFTFKKKSKAQAQTYRGKSIHGIMSILNTRTVMHYISTCALVSDLRSGISVQGKQNLQHTP